MNARVHILALGAMSFGAALFAQSAGFDFMPAGGRAILIELAPPADVAALAALAARRASEEDWAGWARAQNPDLDERAVRTFASYAALNLPITEAALAKLAETGDPMALPPDGKDLAIAHCQYCHSLFTGYLMQERDEVSWLGTFKAPFHAEIPMTETERATFARYSALNMPLKFQDVPPELRF